MSNKPIVLSFDLGATGAWYISNYEYGEEAKMDSYRAVEKLLKDLTELYKPDVIQYPPPVRYPSTIRKHSEFIGIIKLIAEKKGIETIEITDSHAKLEVLGAGKKEKEDIMKHYNVESEHLADVMMMNECFFIDLAEVKRYLDEYRIIYKTLHATQRLAKWIKKDKKYKRKGLEKLIKILNET